MLRSLRIRHFKGIEDVRLELSPFSVLVGKNGVGKSTALQAIETLGRLTWMRIDEILEKRGWSYEDLVHLRAPNRRFGFDAEVVIADHAEAELGPIHWAIEIDARPPGRVHSETVSADGVEWIQRRGRHITRWNQETEKHEVINVTLPQSALYLIDARADREYLVPADLHLWAEGIHSYLTLDPARMRRSSRDADDIGAGGESLAGFLGRLRRRDSEAHDRVVDRVRGYYPRLRGIELKRKRAGWWEMEVVERWGVASMKLNARQVSDGLLRLIGVAALHETTGARVLLLDEIENGLHPRLIGALVQMLQDLVDERSGEVQVITTTHSPLVLSYVRSPEQVVLITRTTSGRVRATRMDRAPNFETLFKVMDVGELWYNAGEELLLRKKPVAK